MSILGVAQHDQNSSSLCARALRGAHVALDVDHRLLHADGLACGIRRGVPDTLTSGVGPCLGDRVSRRPRRHPDRSEDRREPGRTSRHLTAPRGNRMVRAALFSEASGGFLFLTGDLQEVSLSRILHTEFTRSLDFDTSAGRDGGVPLGARIASEWTHRHQDGSACRVSEGGSTRSGPSCRAVSAAWRARPLGDLSAPTGALC